jgi:hypothetical protein
MKTRVTTTTGKSTTLTSCDTLTLAFVRGVESTPVTLRAFISEQSLKRIARDSTDSNERIKADRALSFRLQFSDHGAGSRSAQVFGSVGGLVGDFNL